MVRMDPDLARGRSVTKVSESHEASISPKPETGLEQWVKL
jgi:hypothetical protein